jgi:hypothetical protein
MCPLAWTVKQAADANIGFSELLLPVRLLQHLECTKGDA